MELSLLCDASVVVVMRERSSNQISSYVSELEDTFFTQCIQGIKAPDFTNNDVPFIGMGQYERFFGCNVKKRKYTKQAKSEIEDYQRIKLDNSQQITFPGKLEDKLKEIKAICGELKPKEATAELLKSEPADIKTNFFIDFPMLTVSLY